MKKLMLMALAVVAFATSCSKNDNVPSIENGNGSNQVAISFAYEKPADTRAFFSTTANAETWEKHLSSVTIYAFKASGELLVQRTFSSNEVVSKKALFTIPDTKAGDNCEFYAVANVGTSGIMQKSDLLKVVETSNPYNGLFAEVNTSSKRASGFVMSGTTMKAISASGETAVSIMLKRTVAKIAVETSISPNFSNQYGGMIKVNSAVISKSATRSNVVSQAVKGTGTMSFSHSQASNIVSGKSQNLFYIFENNELAGSSKVTLELNATYDKDGNFTTTSDQVPVVYTILLDGKASGEIIRNGYYRLAVNISGLIGSDTSVSLTVADWDTTETQSVNVGN